MKEFLKMLVFVIVVACLVVILLISAKLERNIKLLYKHCPSYTEELEEEEGTQTYNFRQFI